MQEIAELSLFEAVMDGNEDVAEEIIAMLSQREKVNMVEYCSRVIDLLDEPIRQGW